MNLNSCVQSRLLQIYSTLLQNLVLKVAHLHYFVVMEHIAKRLVDCDQNLHLCWLLFLKLWILLGPPLILLVATPLWRSVRMTLTLPKWGLGGPPKNSELNCRSQNTSPWGVLYTVRKVLKFRCRKWLAWAIWTSAAQVMDKRRVRSQTSSLTLDH
jgi:hypothetical protein